LLAVYRSPRSPVDLPGGYRAARIPSVVSLTTGSPSSSPSTPRDELCWPGTQTTP